MPTKFYVPKDARSSGMSVTFTKSTQKIYISGWYDTIVGIQGETMTLKELFDKLGITEKDCQKAFKQTT